MGIRSLVQMAVTLAILAVSNGKLRLNGQYSFTADAFDLNSRNLA
jgi:hypothetical protein